MSIFDNNSWFVVHFRKATSNKSDDPMFEIRCIIEEYGFTRIHIFESFLKMCFCSSLASFIEMFEFREEFISSTFSGQEPSECREWRIHTTCCIDTRTNLETYDISISLDLFASFEKVPESNRF
jgi:hypothetical protein